MKVSTTQPGLVSKLSLIGSVEVLGDLRHTLFCSRSQSSHSSLVPNQDPGLPSASGLLDELPSLRSTQVLSILMTELEVIEVGVQLHRFRKRIALSNFFEFYEAAQANALSFLHGDLTMRELSHNSPSNQPPRQQSRVLNRIVDLVFPNTAQTELDTVTAGGEIGQPIQAA